MKNLIKRIIPNSIKRALRKHRYDIKKSAFFQKSAKEAFTQIYEKNHWRGKESVSGTGSDTIQTKAIIKAINLLIEELKIKSILDLPCGDFKWMRSVNLDNVEYLGADIVDDLIEKNSKYHSKENIHFEVKNLMFDPLPKSDLILCRDCLVHFSFEDIYAAVQNIKSSECKYLLTTSFTNHNRNYDICTGDWRTLNLQLQPFNFPEPIKIINEQCTEGNGEYKDKSLALYLIENIKLPPTMYMKS